MHPTQLQSYCVKTPVVSLFELAIILWQASRVKILISCRFQFPFSLFSGLWESFWCSERPAECTQHIKDGKSTDILPVTSYVIWAVLGLPRSECETVCTFYFPSPLVWCVLWAKMLNIGRKMEHCSCSDNSNCSPAFQNDSSTFAANAHEHFPVQNFLNSENKSLFCRFLSPAWLWIHHANFPQAKKRNNNSTLNSTSIATTFLPSGVTFSSFRPFERWGEKNKTERWERLSSQQCIFRYKYLRLCQGAITGALMKWIPMVALFLSRRWTRWRSSDSFRRGSGTRCRDSLRFPQTNTPLLITTINCWCHLLESSVSNRVVFLGNWEKPWVNLRTVFNRKLLHQGTQQGSLKCLSLAYKGKLSQKSLWCTFTELHPFCVYF